MQNQSNEQFVADYERYVEKVLSVTRDEAQKLFEGWEDPTYWERYSYKDENVAFPTPVQRIQTRIKRLESVVDKIERQREKVFPEGLHEVCLRRMKDTFGVRIVIFFLCHLKTVDKELRRMARTRKIQFARHDRPEAYMPDDMHRRLELDHIERKEKDSGYVSIHYLVRLKESSVPEEDRPWFEIQVRTLAEDTWGEIEHLLGYKPDRGTSLAVQRQFQIISKQLGAVDEHFNFLYEELLRFQKEDVKVDPKDDLNAENLPSVLFPRNLWFSQSEVNGILKILRSHEVHKVKDFVELFDKTSKSMQEFYHMRDGGPPSTEEYVSTMAYLHKHPEKNYQARIQEWVAITKTWTKIKSEHKLKSAADILDSAKFRDDRGSGR